MKQETSVEIDRPIEEVFEYTLKNVAELSLTVVEDKPIDVKPDGGVGTTFLCITEERGQRMESDGVVTHWEPPRFAGSMLTGKQFDIDVRYAFEDLGGRTRVTQAAAVTPKSLVLKTIFFCFGRLMKKGSCDAAGKELESLKDHLCHR